ncbi:hypothetical protein M440DRAFT_8733 [Trichoderma longibrachiatum ATCC 18648]|uniref:Uncharacterized protein n=1 Tax=Trichoderma longibrachiatum ATCC 18648 TaxID=983965 RepID=A0A2T4BR51_TRILO|nr:hypothetical protein M440DRAFT_8733 [Trichoderma longibrachiatum ATCC 18648]
MQSWANNGSPIAIKAAGLSHDGASDVCEQSFPVESTSLRPMPQLASHPSADQDVIQRAQAIFQKQRPCARLLQADAGYHSSHVILYSESYVESLVVCDIRPKQPREGCTRFSSVDDDRMEGDMIDALKGGCLLEGQTVFLLCYSQWLLSSMQTVNFPATPC